MYSQNSLWTLYIVIFRISPIQLWRQCRFTLFYIQLRFLFLLVMFLRTFIAYKAVFLLKTIVPFR